MTDFIILALSAGCLTVFVTGPIGCFLVWRKMAYVGDAMAHSALLGIALGFALGWSMSIGMLMMCLGFSVLLLWLENHTMLASDTLLGILAHSLLSLGLIWMSVQNQPIHLEGLLFGDILTVTQRDLIGMALAVIFVLAILKSIWHDLLLLTIQPDMAAVEGVAIRKVRWLFMLVLATVIALSVQVIGILLLMALMIIPAATARTWSRCPETMAGLAVIFGLLAVIIGIMLSLVFDWPTGPSIVVIATCAFLFSQCLSAS